MKLSPENRKRDKGMRQEAIRRIAVVLADEVMSIRDEVSEAIAIWLETLGGARDQVLASKIRAGDWLPKVERGKKR